jgi:hypothetical protein
MLKMATYEKYTKTHFLPKFSLTLELDQGKNIPSEKSPRVIPPTIPLKLSAI